MRMGYKNYFLSLTLLICSTFLYGQEKIQTVTGSTGANARTSFSLTLGTAPQAGNTLIAVISGRTTTQNNVTSITQTGVTWTRAVSRVNNNQNVNIEIWYTTAIQSNASSFITFSQGSARTAVSVIEYSGLVYNTPLDRTASNYGNNSTPSTGTTSITTASREVWIGGIGLRSSSYNLTNISNSFTMIDAVSSTNSTATNNARVFSLEKIVTTTGQAYTGGNTTSSRWAGAIATFSIQEASISSFTPSVVYAGGGATITINGAGFTNVTAVRFNGVSATSFTVNSSTQLTATVPAAATSGTITVETTYAGTAVSPSSLTIWDIPQPTAIITNTSCPLSSDGAVAPDNIPTALNFNSLDVNTGGTLLNGLTAFTLEGWIKTTAYNRNSFFGQNDAVEFGFTASGELELWSEGLRLAAITSGSPYPKDGEWHHVAGVGNGSSLRIYIDGVLVVTQTHGALTAPVNYGSSTYNTRLGAYVWGTTADYFNGQMAKAGFWNQELTPAQIANLAQELHQYSNTDTGLIAGFNFFEGSGSTLSHVPSGNAATMTGTPTWSELFEYSWTRNGGGFTSTSKNISGIPTGTYNLSVSGSTTNGANSFVVTTDATQLEWLGYTTDWNTASNWQCGVIPTTDTDVLIPTYPVGGNQPTIGSAGAVCRDITISNGAMVSLGGAYNFAIYNNLTNNGVLKIETGTVTVAGTIANDTIFTKNSVPVKTSYPGTVIYNGTAAQTLINNATYTTLVIDNTTGVYLPASSHNTATSLIINTGAYLEIGTGRAITAATVTNHAGAGGLRLKSDSNVPNGSLIFGNPVGNPVEATVEMYSKAFKSTTPVAGQYYKWQYFGIPLRTLATASPTFDGSFVRKYDATGKVDLGNSNFGAKWDALNNMSALASFDGYEITHDSPRTIVYQGILENGNFVRNSGNPLIYYPNAAYPGHHLFANSYTAAIGIAGINFGAETEATVYLYNTGSYGDWVTEGYGTSDGGVTGQYVAIPKNLANPTIPSGLPREIPSMQGFVIRKLHQDTSNPGTFTVEIPYSTVAGKNTTVQRMATSDSIHPAPLPALYLDVKDTRSTDRLWIFMNDTCSKSFDNGWDGEKLMSKTDAPQLFALLPDRNYQVFTTNSIRNVLIGFMTGKEQHYELVVTHRETGGLYPEGIFLDDLVTGTRTDISADGARYSFTASAGDPVKRFLIRIGNSDEKVEISDDIMVYAINNKLTIGNYSAHDQTVKVYDTLGRLQFTAMVAKGEQYQRRTGLSAGEYIIKFSSGKSHKLRMN